jgi:hypothetical protein
VFDGDRSSFFRLWDAYAPVEASQGNFDLVPLTPWRQDGEDDEYKRIYEIAGHRYIVSFLTIDGTNEITAIYNPTATGTGKSGFVDTFNQKKQDPSDFLRLVAAGVSEQANKSHLVVKKCAALSPRASKPQKEFCYSTSQTLAQFKKAFMSFPSTSVKQSGEISVFVDWHFATGSNTYFIAYTIGDNHLIQIDYLPKSKTRVTPLVRIVLYDWSK